MAEAIVLIPKAFPTAIYLEQANGFVTVEFTSNDLQGLTIECPGDVFSQLNLADTEVIYDIEISIVERG